MSAPAPDPVDSRTLPSRIAERYDVLEEIGRGGMGIVYKARDSHLGRVVALKLLRPGDPEAAVRFSREARLVAGLSHPHVVPVLEFGPHGDSLYFTMPFIDGSDLARLRASRGADFRFFAQRLLEAAEGLHHAHTHGVIHRDVKPQNILVDSAGKAYVADFGLARPPQEFTQLTLSGTILGTPAYMPPEQAKPVHGTPLDARADVYALGATLYFCLTDREPFVGTTVFDVIEQLFQRDPTRPRALIPSVPPELEVICLKAMAKEPARRYATAAEMAEDLRRFLADEPIAARPPSISYRIRRRIRKKPALFGLAAALLAVSGATALLVWGMESQRAKRYRTAWEVLRPVAQALDDLEDLKYRRGLATEDLRGQADLLLRQTEQLMRDLPDFGPAVAWHGRILEILGRLPEAEADYERACALSQESAEAWFVRGMYRLEKYLDSRGLPPATLGMDRISLEPFPPETAEQRAWREGGLRDIERMESLATLDAEFSRDKARRGRATAWLYSGEPEMAVAELEGHDDPSSCRLRGAALYALNRFDEARESFRRAADRWPARADLWIALGGAAHAAGLTRAQRGEDPRPFYESAVEALTRAVGIDPRIPDAYTDRAKALRDRGDWSGRHGQDPLPEYAAAVEDCDRALALDPGDHTAWLDRGNARLAAGRWRSDQGADPLGDYEAAIDDYSHAVVSDPRPQTAHHNRGSAHLAVAEWKISRGLDPSDEIRRAMVDFARALEIDSDDSAAYCHRGGAQLLLGQWRGSRREDPTSAVEAAIRDYTETLRRSPDYVDAWCHRGSAHGFLAAWVVDWNLDPGDGLRTAIEDFTRALELDPVRYDALLGRGAAWWTAGRWDAAQGRDPAGAYTSAVEDLARAIAQNPNSAEAFQNRGAVHATWGDWRGTHGEDPSGQYANAIQDYGAALSIRPDFVEAYVNRGNVRRRLASWKVSQGGDPAADFEASLRDFSDALAVNPTFVPAFNNRGMTYRERGAWLFEAGGSPVPDLEAAIADYSRALEISPEYANSLVNRATARGLLGDWLAQDPGADPPRAASCLRDAASDYEAGLRLWPSHPQAEVLRSKIAELRAAADALAGTDF